MSGSKRRPRSVLVSAKRTLPILAAVALLLPVNNALAALQNIAPLGTWADACNVGDIWFKSGQAVCDARRPGLVYQTGVVRPQSYFIEEGNCFTPDFYASAAYPTNGFYCPKGYGMINVLVQSCGGTGALAGGPNVQCVPLAGINLNKNFGGDGKSCPLVLGNPINPGIGDKSEVATDYQGVGAFPIRMSRTYHSLNTNSSLVNSGQAPGTNRFGSNWTSNYEQSVQSYSNAGITTAFVSRPDGRLVIFNQSGSTWIADEDISDRLASQTDALGHITGWTYTTVDENVESYDSAGKLTSITTRSGLTQTLTYSDATTPASVAYNHGLVIRITDTFGKKVDLTYDGYNRALTMTDSNGGLYQYGYDANNNLASVTYPDGKVRTYVYDEPAVSGNTEIPHALTGIIDENNQRFSTYTYFYNPGGGGFCATALCLFAVSWWLKD